MGIACLPNKSDHRPSFQDFRVPVSACRVRAPALLPRRPSVPGHWNGFGSSAHHTAGVSLAAVRASTLGIQDRQHDVTRSLHNTSAEKKASRNMRNGSLHWVPVQLSAVKATPNSRAQLAPSDEGKVETFLASMWSASYWLPGHGPQLRESRVHARTICEPRSPVARVLP